MLNYHMNKEQTFENLIQEARNQIPLYTKEWTNFNPSDPAETILENMSAFSILQQAYIDRMPETVQEKIYRMAGFEKKKGKSARILLEASNVTEPVHIPSGQRFRLGNLFFETNRDFLLRGNKLTGIYSKWKDEITDYSYLLDDDYPVAGEIFTRQPMAGMELYLMMDEIAGPGEDLIFYVSLAGENHRNAFEGRNLFAGIQWQLYTEKGFVDIKCKDATGSFLASGELSFHMPGQKAAVFEMFSRKGYSIRGILKRADYDLPPKIDQIRGFLFAEQLPKNPKGCPQRKEREK